MEILGQANWYAFFSKNTATSYGLGFPEEVAYWLKRLNSGRSLHLFHASLLSGDEIEKLGLNRNKRGFDLGEEIASLEADMGVW